MSKAYTQRLMQQSQALCVYMGNSANTLELSVQCFHETPEYVNECVSDFVPPPPPLPPLLACLIQL